ncbi:MAG: Spermine synthase [Microgenomates group bacterium GW2011_GWA2_46_16]|nr:MAG: Spermine synthase [Microgenomates group bacterium GW2011_GWA2_46_16]
MLFKTSSFYNQDIRVFGGFWGPKLFVNGSWQSGPYIRKLWNHAFRKFKIDTFKNIRTILILGVGGGTVIELLARRHPNATITAVDIDETIIDIARRYFHADTITNLRVVCGDAKVFVRSGNRYDLVIVDLFIGPKIPEFVSLPSFQKDLYRITKSDGYCCINYLREIMPE